jgi:hypothetical protein
LITNKRYKTSIILNDKKVIPSDTFKGSHSKYILMDIFEAEK